MKYALKLLSLLMTIRDFLISSINYYYLFLYFLKINNINKIILAHQFIFISSCLQYLLQSNLNESYKNTSNTLNIINELLQLLIYKNTTNITIDKIIKILEIMKTAIVIKQEK